MLSLFIFASSVVIPPAFTWIVSTGEVVGGFFVLWYALPKFWKHVLVPIANTINHVDQAADAAPSLLDLAKLTPDIEEMLKQFHPNGGSSLVDRMAKIEAAVKENNINVDVRLRHVEAAIKRVEDKQ